MTVGQLDNKIQLLSLATQRAAGGDPTVLDNRLQSIRQEADAVSELVNGNEARNAIYERTQPTVRSRLGFVMTGVGRSTYGPTATHRQQLDIAKSEFAAIKQRVATLVDVTIPAYEEELIAAGAPWVPGAKIP